MIQRQWSRFSDDALPLPLMLLLETLSKLRRRPRGGGQQANFHSEGLKTK